MMNRALLTVAVLVAPAAGLVVAGPAEELNVGDAAPPLTVKEFVKGDAVKSFEKGKIYVVEFWATWCGPCRMSIPHLTDLQKEHKDATFIGVSVFENDEGGVKPFVKEMGDKMNYRVAMDDVADKTNPSDGKMAKAWMTAAAQQGIPTAFIVNGEGKIAWIGHPMVMDKALGEIESGKWDLAAAAKEFKQRAAENRKIIAVQQRLAKAGDSKERLAVIEQVITEEPKLEKLFANLKFRLLLTADAKSDKASAYAKRLVEVIYADNPAQLNFIAWSIIDPQAKIKPDAALVKVALQAAIRADELSKGKDPAVADTLAKAYFDSGDIAKAIETQERAVKLAAGTQLEKDDALKDLKDRLEQYKKAVKKE